MANPQMEISQVATARVKRGASSADKSGIAGITEATTLAEISAIAKRMGANALDLVRPILSEVT